jgi:hypothetical protein
MKVTRSSLFPTAIVLPSGDHVILIFSPGKQKNYEQKLLKWLKTLFIKEICGNDASSGVITASNFLNS